MEGGLHTEGQGVFAVEAWEAVVREWDVGFCGFRGGALLMEVAARVYLWEWVMGEVVSGHLEAEGL